MARRAFYSFHYIPDNWRASQVRNAGVLEGNRPVSDNDWETVTKGGDKAIKDWINNQMSGKSVVVVLAGSNTSGRKWINYEIVKGWNDGKGVLCVHVHNLQNAQEKQSAKGSNPLWHVGLKDSGTRLSTICNAHDPDYQTSTYVYNNIKDNLADWVEQAITIREKYSELVKVL